MPVPPNITRTIPEYKVENKPWAQGEGSTMEITYIKRNKNREWWTRNNSNEMSKSEKKGKPNTMAYYLTRDYIMWETLTYYTRETGSMRVSNQWTKQFVNLNITILELLVEIHWEYVLKVCLPMGSLYRTPRQWKGFWKALWREDLRWLCEIIGSFFRFSVKPKTMQG